MRWFTIKQMADHAGVSLPCLRIWERRYAWPDHVRKDNGYRLYSEATVEMVAAFVRSGRPFHEIRDGVWTPAVPIDPNQAAASTPTFLATFAELDQRFLTALHVGDMGTVAHWLAALPTWHPDLRARYVACVRSANDECGGVYSRLMARFQITEPKAQEAEA